MERERRVKKTNESRKSALENLRKARENGISRTELHEVINLTA
jgi:hypothetical protein